MRFLAVVGSRLTLASANRRKGAREAGQAGQRLVFHNARPERPHGLGHPLPPPFAPWSQLHMPFHPTDYRSVIASALQARPFDEESVHDCVCTYVRAERDRGRASSDVIVALTELVEQKGLMSRSVRHALTRQVIPWCVAAYFMVTPDQLAALPRR